jgi:4a-hydroxytetrahydrobiopterin dehydratase
MSDLTSKKCVPCEGGMPALSASTAQGLLRQLQDGWSINAANTEIRREFNFKDFYRTMSFVNAVAHVANREDHHPDLEVGYNYCRIRYSTHAIKGLSENDFICAAKIDALGT